MTIITASTRNEAALTGVDAPLTWDRRADRIRESIFLGIEQARMGLIRLQTDTDLPTDDDE